MVPFKPLGGSAVAVGGVKCHCLAVLILLLPLGLAGVFLDQRELFRQGVSKGMVSSKDLGH